MMSRQPAARLRGAFLFDFGYDPVEKGNGHLKEFATQDHRQTFLAQRGVRSRIEKRALVSDVKEEEEEHPTLRKSVGCVIPEAHCRRRVYCRMTGANCTSQELASCLPDSFDGLMLTGHYDSNGTLKPLPSLPAFNELYLGKRISDIRARAFVTLASVQRLTLNGNSIRVVGKWFDGLKDTKQLSLSRNKIEGIARGAFEPLQKLEILDLDNNRIQNVESWYFEGLSSLSKLRLDHNKISRVAANAFNHMQKSILNLGNNMLNSLSAEKLFERLPQRATVYLNSNMLSTIGQKSLVALRGKYLRAWNNPFRCTCALPLTSLKSEGRDIMRRINNLYCSYPPHLAGKKIPEVSLEDMPCPPPVAKVSRADNGTTLLCEVYWEQQPNISWVGPAGSNITNTSANGITAHLEHAVTHTGHSISFWTNGSSQHTEGSTFNYMGKSIYKLQVSQEDFLEWPEDSYRCVITYPVGTYSVSMTLSLIRPKANESRSLTSDDREGGSGPSTDLSRAGVLATTEMPTEYFEFLLPSGNTKHPQYPCTLNLIYAVVIAVNVSLLVGFLVGWLICHKIPPNGGDGRARRDFPPLLTPYHRGSLFSLHHYEVIPDEKISSLPHKAKHFLNPQYGQGNMAPQRLSKKVFVNPQYGQGNTTKQRRSKTTDVFLNPQYHQGKAKLKRRWSAPVLQNGQLVGQQEHPCPEEKAKQIKNLRRLRRNFEEKKSQAPSPHRYTLPETKMQFRESAGYGKEGCD
ncbi:hypothetical protein Bbelb_006690 [Branchiostoma belcheri]|nr:hypothetical protein Bbelb_006690 [Branchiostoma belcheri]